MSPSTETKARFFIIGMPKQGLQQWHLLDATLSAQDAERNALILSKEWKDVGVFQQTHKIIVEQTITRTVQHTGTVYRPEHDSGAQPKILATPTPEGYKLTAPPAPEHQDG